MTSITIRIDEDVKNKAEELFDDLGLSMSAAINMFLRQAVRQQEIPFVVGKNVPNKTTMKAIEDAVNGKGISGPFESVDELMKALNAED